MCKKVDIIVVNWNSGESTLNAIRPYIDYKSATIYCNIIVVDNASTDNSQVILKNKVNKLITNDKNVGFGKACNQAFTGSTADYILLLNPDTLSEPVVLEKLVEFLGENPAYGIIGPSQLDKNKKVLKTCGRFPTYKTAIFEILGISKILPKVFTPAPIMVDWDHSESRDVDHVMGSYMVIRKSVLDEIGFMDDRYFMYLEDMDLSKRFSDAFFKTFYHSNYSIFHEGGGTGHKQKEHRLFYSLSSRRMYWRKHLAESNYLLLTALSITAEPVLRIIDSTVKEGLDGTKKVCKAYYMYLKSLLRPKPQ